MPSGMAEMVCQVLEEIAVVGTCMPSALRGLIFVGIQNQPVKSL